MRVLVVEDEKRLAAGLRNGLKADTSLDGLTPGSSSRRPLQELAEALGVTDRTLNHNAQELRLRPARSRARLRAVGVIGCSSVMPRSCATQTWRQGGQVKSIDPLAESMR